MLSLIILVTTLLLATPVHAAPDIPPDEKEALHRSSEIVAATHDGKALRGASLKRITDHLYDRARPHVRAEDSGKPRAEVDNIVRNYMRDRYARVLLDNYAMLYRNMLAEGADFATCASPDWFAFSGNLQAALCIDEEVQDGLTVRYLTRSAGGKGKYNAGFGFSNHDGSFLMTRIDLALPEDAAFHIKGL